MTRRLNRRTEGTRGAGHRAAHAGGQHVWRLTDADQLLVAWKSTPGEASEGVEAWMLGSFFLTYDQRRFANRQDGRPPRPRQLRPS